MLQTGAVLRDLTVRELLDMMASLYPNPLPVDETMRAGQASPTSPTGKTHKLSGGQTQRVRFAVALVSNPDLLVLDEPTVAMDVEARRDFWATMRDFAARGKTVVFATHYLEEADAYADRIILMARGRIVADGPATEIKATVGLRTIRATLPGADLARAGRAARRHQRRAARRGGRAAAAPTPTRRSARCSPAYPARPRHRGHRRRPGRGVPATHRRRRDQPATRSTGAPR